MKSSKKNFIFISVGILILLLIVIISYKNSQSPKIEKTPDGLFVTREEVKGNYSVPEIDSENVPATVAKPFRVLPTIPREGAKKTRIFNLIIENDEFKPKTIIINDWDEMAVYIKAIDKDYDFIQPNLNISRKIPKGETVLVKNSFGQEGGIRLYFYCPSCGGPEKGPIGEIIIVPKKE